MKVLDVHKKIFFPAVERCKAHCPESATSSCFRTAAEQRAHQSIRFVSRNILNRTTRTSGRTAPSSGFPTPSNTRKVGICVSFPVTELKKLSSETIGEFVVGRRSSLRTAERENNLLKTIAFRETTVNSRRIMVGEDPSPSARELKF